MDTEADSGMRRRVFIGVALCMAVGLFFAMAGIIWHRSSWRKPITPSSILVVEGSKEFEGTKIVIKGPALGKPLKAEITEDKSFACRFALPKGECTLSMEFMNGVHREAKMQIDEYQYFLFTRARLEECKQGVLRGWK